MDFAASQAHNGNVQPDSPWVRGILQIPYQQISAFFDDLQTRRRSLHVLGQINKGGALELMLELVAGVENHHPARSDGNDFAGAGIAAWPLRLFPQLEMAEPGKFDIFAAA